MSALALVSENLAPREGTPGRHEPLHADMSLPDLLGKASHRYADHASLGSKRTFTIQHSCF